MKSFPSIGTPRTVAKAPKVKQAKYLWIVVFRNGDRMEVPVARGAKDARLQAMWIVKEKTGAWPTSGIVEVQKRPTGTNGLMYVSYRTKR